MNNKSLVTNLHFLEVRHLPDLANEISMVEALQILSSCPKFKDGNSHNINGHSSILNVLQPGTQTLEQNEKHTECTGNGNHVQKLCIDVTRMMTHIG